MKVLIPLAEGFEEIEATVIIDVLRRAGIEVTTVFLKSNPVAGAHNIVIKADENIDNVAVENFNAVVLPGGMPGSKNLKDDSRIIDIVKDINSKGGIVSAICAAPMVLGHAGILQDRKSTCYPGFERFLTGSKYTNEPVEIDGNIITGKGPGCAILFALKLVEKIKDKETADDLMKAMQVY